MTGVSAKGGVLLLQAANTAVGQRKVPFGAPQDNPTPFITIMADPIFHSRTNSLFAVGHAEFGVMPNFGTRIIRIQSTFDTSQRVRVGSMASAVRQTFPVRKGIEMEILFRSYSCGTLKDPLEVLMARD